MDITKLQTTLNEFQNALERVRPIVAMSQRAADLWEMLKDVDPKQIEAAANEKTALERNVNELRAKHGELANKILTFNDDMKKREAQLLSDAQRKIDEKNEAYNQEQNKVFLANDAHIKEQENTINALRTEIAELTRKKGALDIEIAALRSRSGKLQELLHG